MTARCWGSRPARMGTISGRRSRRPGCVCVARAPGALLAEMDGFVDDGDVRLTTLALVHGDRGLCGAGGRGRMSPRPRPGILDVRPYKGGESKVVGQNRVIKLSSNEGAFGTPPGAQAAWAAAAAEAFRYPDGAALELRRAIGARFGLDPERIVCGAGSDELIALLIHAYGGPGTEMVISEFAFSMYEIYGHVAGCTVREGARAGPDRGRGRHAGAGLAGDTAGVPGQPEQPDRDHAAAVGGRAAAAGPAGGGAAGAGRGVCRVCGGSRLRPGRSSWWMPATTR